MTKEEAGKTINENLSTVKELLCIAEEFNCWLEDMSDKYNWDKDDVQFLIKQFLMCDSENNDIIGYGVVTSDKIKAPKETHIFNI